MPPNHGWHLKHREVSKITKSPYEIRLDVLQLAKDMIDKNNDIAIAKMNSGIHTPGKPAITEITSCSTTEIIARASELYAFVNDKKL
jgi:glycosylphosphatidylinositol transamidase (GPIT) subunit GPI8